MKDKKQQPTVSEEEINDLIQPHAITLEHGEKAAKDIFELLNRDESLNVHGEEPPEPYLDFCRNCRNETVHENRKCKVCRHIEGSPPIPEEKGDKL